MFSQSTNHYSLLSSSYSQLCDLLLQVLDSDSSCVTKFEKFLASAESVTMLSKLCFNSMLTEEDKEGGKDTKCSDSSDAALSDSASGTGTGSVGEETVGDSARPGVPPLPLDAIPGAGIEEDVAQQKKATLAYNALLLLRKLSERCPTVLYSNPALLCTLRQLVPVYLAISEGCNSSHVLSGSILPYADSSLHQKASVTMEMAYRNAHQLKVLCEIIIRYCRSNPADANSSNSFDTFELMAFSLLPVLTMKICILDFTFLVDFYRSEIPYLCFSPPAKKQILRKTFSLVAGKKASVALKVKIIQVSRFFYLDTFFVWGGKFSSQNISEKEIDCIALIKEKDS
jgi:hypothetical protein